METSAVTNDNMGFSKVNLGAKLASCHIQSGSVHVVPVEGFRVYIAFRADFHFCRIYLILGGLTSLLLCSCYHVPTMLL